MSLAWHIAALHRQKKLPSLKSLLAKQPRQRQNPKQLRSALTLMSAQLGIPLRRASKKVIRGGAR